LWFSIEKEIWLERRMVGKRVLILGGTTEALEAAERLSVLGRVTVITSMAGVTRNPRLPGGENRAGGFGGVLGLTAYLDTESIAAVLDATHPFAAQISRHAGEAGSVAGVPVLHLTRPPWRRCRGDQWHEVDSAVAAATWLSTAPFADGSTVFLTIGRAGIAAFSEMDRLRCVSRSIDPPNFSGALPFAEVILARGPFSVDDERQLMVDHNIVCLVAKNSGGAASYSKIEAARALGLLVVMITPPAVPGGESTSSVDVAVTWVHGTLGISR
jgi:precorrin-6A/cobalt-precorrin-6A reductase